MSGRTTPEPPQPKRLGSDAWLRMIVLGVIFSLVATIVLMLVLSSMPLSALVVVVPIAFAIGTFAAGRIVGWYGAVRWIAAFCVIVLISSAIALACVSGAPRGAFY
ncbi:MAG TPA: hypothetical protein VFN41_08410 [Candidatus Limnocylindrales bacterium]|nr:hypothetical protein [Candidatus Limnocylindrales bacterium]